MSVNLDLNTSDIVTIILLVCLLGLAVRIIIGFFKENK